MRKYSYYGISTRNRSTFRDESLAFSQFRADAYPKGFGHFHEKSVSGEVTLEIEIASPTIPGSVVDCGGNDALAVPSRSGSKYGAVSLMDSEIPVSSLKGVISSAYELVTSSRFRVFGSHQHQLTNRRTKEEAGKLVPVILKNDGTSFYLDIMPGTNDVDALFKGRGSMSSYAAIIPGPESNVVDIIDDNGNVIIHDGRKMLRHKDLAKLLGHGSMVKVILTPEDVRGKFVRYVVTDVWNNELGKFEKFFRLRHGNSKSHDVLKTSGLVVRTAPYTCLDNLNSRLIDTKVNEFLFFRMKSCRSNHFQISAGDVSSLKEVLHSYIKEILLLKSREERGGPAENANGRAWYSINNRVVSDIVTKFGLGEVTRDNVGNWIDEQSRSESGLPLFAEIDWCSRNLISLSPVQIGRRAVGVSPFSLAKDACMNPVLHIKHSSPGERLFGFVIDEDDVRRYSFLHDGRQDFSRRSRKTNKSNKSVVAYRGHIMISPIVPVESDTDFLARCRLNQPWYLKTLANPKPSTGVPYFHNSSGRVDELRTRGDAYSKNDLLVRKVYPTHRDMLFETSLGKAEEDPGQINPTQNSRVVSYLKPGAKFRTTMRFVDISRQELAILLWLLNPKNLVPYSQKTQNHFDDQVGYHRLGHGKPYGLGAVKITAIDLQCVSTENLRSSYNSIEGCLGFYDEEICESSIDSFEQYLPLGFDASSSVKAFIVSAYGFAGPVQYPGAHNPLRDGDISPIINWFQRREKNRVDTKLGKDRIDTTYNYGELERDL